MISHYNGQMARPAIAGHVVPSLGLGRRRVAHPFGINPFNLGAPSFSPVFGERVGNVCRKPD